MGAVICEWKKCPVVARFHIEVPPSTNLNGDAVVQLSLGHTHHNVCAAHMDQYSAIQQPRAIYVVGKCPHCDRA
jgi:hypothetical protein